ncbi:unnamed protein product [Mytilus coruscus]|uniref:Uncharacterized protein n=1 Tax=Mytilus coruscus TaxID=42192 RepID=A0A6J8C9H7_MYTCO|nr:unnamed protein product [Mytilus coruscus]
MGDWTQEQAKELPQENNVITIQDIKQAAFKSTGEKWQRRWELFERGRDLYEKIPTTKHSILLDDENIKETKAKLQTVAHYIDRTGRFDTAVPQSQSNQRIPF